MKLGENDKKWLKDEISKQVKEAIADAIDEFRPHGWRRVTNFIRSWGIAGTIITVFVALFGIAAGAIYQATARVAKEATFETNTQRDLKQIREDIKAIRGDLAKQSIINHASLPLSDFKATLPDLRSTVATAIDQQIKVPQPVLTSLQKKIIASKDAPDYWPTAAQFLSFRSQNLAPSPEIFSAATLPRCTDSDPNPARVTATGEGGSVKRISAPYYENCQFTIDSPKDDSAINTLLRTKLTIVFRHCLIVYSGGAFTLVVRVDANAVPMTPLHGHGKDLDVNYHGPALQFQDCLFRFSATSSTPDAGKHVIQYLLTQNGTLLNWPLV